MGKRILISLLMTLLVIVLVTAGAALIFHNNYTTIASLEAQAPEEPEQSALPTLQATEPQVQVTATQPDSTPQPSEDPGNSRAKSIVSEMTLQEKLCQMLIATPEALTGYTRVTQSGDATREAISSYPVGGMIYFESNLVTADQTREMIENVQSYARERNGMSLMIGVDEEGGSVARLANTLGTVDFETMSYYGQEGDPEAAYDIARAIAVDMKNLGFNLDFAPVADVLTNPDNTVIGDRSFGSDPQLVSDFVSREVRGFVENGILCSPKHFPGHGSTGGDTHNGYDASERTREELESTELLPFRAAIRAGAPMIMVGHMTMTAIDPDRPASLSPTVVGMLRQEYDGIIITDALNMGAVANQYSTGESAVLAVQAGCDMLLCVSDVPTAVEALTQAVENGEISREQIDQSVVRIIAAKLQYGLAA